ncbi:hypothetical protein EC988_007768, partial [Linderina pennispora]
MTNNDGSVVVYPKLHDLRLKTAEGFFRMTARPSIDGVPFPALRSLAIHGRNSFLDDSILRGSEDSLTFLDMNLRNSTIDILSEA